MQKYFSQLRPMERRLVIGVLVVVFLVVNAWQVWPHFSDWGKLRQRLDDAHRKLKLYQAAAQQIPDLTKQVKKFESQGEFVTPENQNIDFMRTVQGQAAASGVGIQNYS